MSDILAVEVVQHAEGPCGIAPVKLDVTANVFELQHPGCTLQFRHAEQDVLRQGQSGLRRLDIASHRLAQGLFLVEFGVVVLGPAGRALSVPGRGRSLPAPRRSWRDRSCRRTVGCLPGRSGYIRDIP